MTLIVAAPRLPTFAPGRQDCGAISRFALLSSACSDYGVVDGHCEVTPSPPSTSCAHTFSTRSSLGGFQDRGSGHCGTKALAIAGRQDEPILHADHFGGPCFISSEHR
ncbi:hypothetical protein, partial [Curtobacterium sp. MMLR14_002]|uniref:hypothetical protein n=1 Tax=Curtobacterium sp. MMLR14_002 TaxID=1898741 RepID=UPI001C0B30BD